MWLKPKRASVLIVAAATFLSGAAAQAAPDVPAPQGPAVPQADLPAQAPAVVAHWINEDGSIETHHGASVSSQWVWLKGPPDQRPNPLAPPDPRRSRGEPAIEVRFQTRAMSPSWKLVQVVPNGSIIEELTSPEKDDPRLRSFRIALLTETSVIDFAFLEGNTPHRMSLLLTTPELPPVIIKHKSCGDFYLDPASKEPTAVRHLFVSVACTEDDDSIYFQVIRSDDAHWAYAPGNPDAAKSMLVFPVYRESPKFVDRSTILEVRTRDAAEELLVVQVKCVDGAETCRRLPRWQQ